MSKLGIFFDHNSDKELQNNNNELIYPFKKCFSYKLAALIPVAAMCASSAVLHAATLEQRAVYQMRILPAGDPAQIGQCSAFTFGDISTLSCPPGGPVAVGSLHDNENSSFLPFFIEGGNGVAGDGLAGMITIETAKANLSGGNTFTVTDYQVDPYLQTAGGTFKTTMTPPTIAPPPLWGGTVPQVAAVNNGSGTVTAAGEMTLDVDGRTGIAGGFLTVIGLQEWNRDDTSKVNVTTETGQYELFTTGSDSNVLAIDGSTNVTLTGRAIADTAPTDGILDAILVAAGNVGQAWTGFDGIPYTEGYNVQFVLVSANPVANPDPISVPFNTPVVIDIAADLIANDVHATGDTLSFVSFTQPLVAGSSVALTGGGTTLTYTPDPFISGTAADSFTYTIKDSGATLADEDTATVVINLPTGSSPVAVADPVNTNEDTLLAFDPTANDTDPDQADTLSLLSFDGVSAQGGTIVAGVGNSVSYTPPANFFSPPDDTFKYKVTDGNGWDPEATVTVTVAPVNDPLVCQDVALSTTTDTPLSADINTGLLATCTDIDTTDTFALTSVQTPTDQGGNISDDGAGTLTYTPALGFSGTDTFTYTANDGTVDDAPRTVTVTVGNFGNFTMLLKATGEKFGGTNDVIFDWPFYDAVKGGDLSSLNTDTVDYANNVKFDMSITSSGPQPFFSAIWIAHSIRVFGPGTWSFDSGCTKAEITATGCPADSVGDINGKPTPNVTMTVGPGQVGAHILFDYNGSFNIDVLNLWDFDGVWNDPDGAVSIANNLFDGVAGSAPDPETTWNLVSRDVNGDGFNGMPMVDGPFLGYYANFNDTPAGTTGSLPPITGTVTDTKLGSGALGLASLFGILPVIGFFRRRLKR